MFSGEIVAPFGETSQPRLENSGIRNCLQGVRKEERKKDRLIEGYISGYLVLPSPPAPSLKLPDPFPH